jgi:hypothetical protein
VNFRFNIDILFREIQLQLGRPEIIHNDNGYNLLGTYIKNNDEWQILFSFKKNVSFGSLVDFKIKYPSRFTLLILEENSSLEAFDIALFKRFGIYLTRWDQKLINLLDQIYANELLQLTVVKDLQNQSNLSDLLNLELTKTATDEKGNPFEKTVFEAIEKIFHVTIPLVVT